MKKIKKKIGDFEQVTVVGDYNEFLKRYEDQIPAIREMFKRKKVPFPDDPYDLFDEVVLRYFKDDDTPLKFDDFLKASMKLLKEMEVKTDIAIQSHKRGLSFEVEKRINSFCRAVAKKYPTEAKELLTVLEIILNERPGFPPLKNKTATIKEIKGHECYQSKNLKEVSHPTETGWLTRYIEEYC